MNRRMKFKILIAAIGRTLAPFVDTVMADLNRAFGRFRIWSFISIPFILAFMSLKWSIMVLLLPISFIINITNTINLSHSQK